jgi:hypothetical protein
MSAQRAEDGYSEPPLAEVEGARLLANENRDELRAAGLTDEQIRKLADDYIAETKGDPADFVPWARERARRDDVP